jgi:hypothetical protein
LKSLNLPPIEVRLLKKNGKTYIYDTFRRKEVALTPEEWVRQHFISFLVSTKGYPPERIANEVYIRLNAISKRCDTVVYDDYLNPLAIVEYKAPDVAITESVFDQVARYNSVLRVPYLMVSNGLSHYCCNMDYRTMQCSFLKDIPAYPDIKRASP